MKNSRDLRIDFFKGLALLSIIANHINLFTQEWYLKLAMNWVYPGLSDAAELFVFLSGYVFGLVYFKYMKKNGFTKMLIKSINRSKELYIINILTFYILIGALGAFKVYFPENFPDFYHPSVDTFFKDPFSAIAWGGLMIYQMPLFGILPLYVILILMAPFFLKMIEKNPLLALAVSFILYVIANLFNNFNFPNYPFSANNHWGFNPFAWQLIFVLGMTISVSIYKNVIKIPKSKPIFYMVVFILLVSLIPRAGFIFSKLGLLDSYWIESIGMNIPFAGKQNLEPIRLIHFFSLVYFVWFIFPLGHKFFSIKLVKPIILCGQNSLNVFVFGLVITYVAYFSLHLIGISSLNFHFITLVSISLTLAWGYFSHGKKDAQLGIKV